MKAARGEQDGRRAFWLRSGSDLRESGMRPSLAVAGRSWMPRGRSDMRRVKEVLRLAHELGYSNRQIEVSVRLGRTTVGGYLARARAAGVRYADVAEMSETVIAALLFKCPEPSTVRPQPDWSTVAAEMRRRGVTLLLLWQEYRDQHPDGYSYSQFRRYYRAHQRLSGAARLRRTPVPAAMCEVDYAGQTMMVATANAKPACLSVRCRSRPPSTPRRAGRRAPRTGWAAMCGCSTAGVVWC